MQAAILDKTVRLEAIPDDLIPLLVAALDEYTLAHQFSTHDEQESRRLYLLLASKLAASAWKPQWSSLVPLANCFAKRNRPIISQIVEKGPSDQLEAILRGLVQQMESLSETKHLTMLHLDRISRIAHMLVCLVWTSTSAASIMAKKDYLLPLATLYSHSASLLKRISVEPMSEDGKKYLNARIDLLTTFSTCLGMYFPLSLAKVEVLSDLMISMLDLPESNGDELGNNLLVDLEGYVNVSSWFSERVDSSAKGDERLQYIKSSLASMQGANGKMLDLLRAGESKPASDPLQEAVEAVQAVLPDQTNEFLTQAFALPTFHSGAIFNSEKLIQSILEGTLPSTLNPSASTFSPSTQSPPLLSPSKFDPSAPSFAPAMSPSSSFNPSAEAFTPAPTLLSQRANIYDSQPLTSDHFARRVEANTNISSELKATIIAMAEHESDEEEYEQEEEWDSGRAVTGGKVVVDEWDDYGLAATEGDDEEEEEEEPSAVFSERVVEVLSKAYVEHGLEVLLRNKGKPVTKARAELMESLKNAGWKGDGASDLIESWGKQLDRDPKKQKRLAAFEWSGNRSNATPEPTSSRGHSRGRGRGGPSRGGSDRGRGGGQRGAHQRRQRGHDKKTRGGMMG